MLETAEGMFSHHGELGISLMYSSSRVRLQKLWEGEKGEKESFGSRWAREKGNWKSIGRKLGWKGKK